MGWPTSSAILSTARSLIGLAEYPDGSNHNEITQAYGIGDGPWCAMFVWYVYHQNGVDLRTEFTQGWAATTDAADAAKAKGMWHDGLDGVAAGDAVFYRIPGGDAGYVNHVGIWEGNGVSIDGNWSNHVEEVAHPASEVVGYIRFPLTDDGTGAGVPATTPNAPAFPGRYLVYVPGHAQIQGEDVRQWQQRMADRGWTIGVDGIYGPQSYTVCVAFQREKALTPDGIVGPLTWAAAWTAPVTR
jgi:hypothetical protein